ncbi:MAG: potassium transporter TrkG, partial [Bacteroidales bacterium]
FGVKNSSIGEYNSFSQYTIILFMLLSGINFNLHYYFIKRRLFKILKDEELRLYLMIIVGFTVTIALSLIFIQGRSIEPSFRSALFQVVSILSCTGFITDDYLVWPQFSWLLIFALMFVGGCAGSTSGGIKVIRHVIMFKAFKAHFYKLIHPNSIKSIKYNGKTIEDINQVFIFILFYIFIFGISTLLLSFNGVDLITGMGATTATMGGIGPGLGSVGSIYNYNHLPDFSKIILSFNMLLGRLELFPLLLMFSPAFWKR